MKLSSADAISFKFQLQIAGWTFKCAIFLKGNSMLAQLFPKICRNRLHGVPIEKKHVKGGGLQYGGLS